MVVKNINGMVQDFYDSDQKRGFVGGYAIALTDAEMGPARFFTRWLSGEKLIGRGLYRRMDDTFGHSIAISAYGEQLPDPDNRVTLDPTTKDTFGLPVPHVHNVLSANY